MTIIAAIIRPHLLEPVREALEEIDLIGMTASDCRGTGRQKTASHSFRGSQYSHGLDPRVRIEVLVADEHVDAAVDAIQKSANTGEIGDGKIFYWKLDNVVRIRTNERGDAAL